VITHDPHAIAENEIASYDVLEATSQVVAGVRYTMTIEVTTTDGDCQASRVGISDIKC
jgi:hypothetical protein